MAAEMTTVRRLAGGAVIAGALLFAGTARAEKGDVAAAANAFTRAQRAALRGDYQHAAELFELADSLSPSPEAVRSAVDARRAAGQLALAAGEAEELKRRYPKDPKSMKLADQVIALARKTLARQVVTCAPSACQLVVDGAAASTNTRLKHVIYLEPGKHTLRAVFGDRQTAPASVVEKAGGHARVEFHEPPAAPEPKAKPKPAAVAPAPAPKPPMADHGTTARRESHGLSPWYFATGAVVTAAVGGVSIWSGLDTLKANDTYKQHETQAGYQDGLSRERRTNILFAVTGVAAAATVTLALFTDFSGGKSASASTGVKTTITASPDGARLLFRGRF